MNMTVQLTPLAQSIFEKADKACSEFQTEEEFFASFGAKVLAEAAKREEGIAAAISEIVIGGRWPWRRT